MSVATARLKMFRVNHPGCTYRGAGSDPAPAPGVGVFTARRSGVLLGELLGLGLFALLVLAQVLGQRLLADHAGKAV